MVAPDFELFGGTGNVWKLYKQGQFIGNFILDEVESTYKQDSQTMNDRYGNPVAVVNYNARYKIKLKGVMYPDIPGIKLTRDALLTGMFDSPPPK